VLGARSEGREAWLDTLAATVARFAAGWSLEVGRPYQPGGHTAWVAPALRNDGTELVLKVLWRHPEAEHEAGGLAAWAGHGAVRLYEVAELDDTIVLLLERCVPGRALREEPETRQDEVILELLPRLWVPPPAGHCFPPLTEMCEQWADRFEEQRAAGKVALDVGLATEGIGLFRSLPRSADDEPVLLCTDLHAGNVLTAQRERWLMVDPKPHVGDRTYDVLQHFLNCAERLHVDPLGLIAKFADRLDLDRERLRLWLFARCVQESPRWPNLAAIARHLAGAPGG